MTQAELKKKRDNYWYYYKWHTLAGAFILLVLIVTVTQCAHRVNPDVNILMVTGKTLMSDDTQAALEKDLARYADDLNGDGKRVASITPIDLSGGGNPQMQQAMASKLMAMISTGDTFVFFVDSDGYDYLTKQGGFFQKANGIVPGAKTLDDGLRLSLAETSEFGSDAYGDFSDVSAAVRVYSGTTADTTKNKPYYEGALRFLSRMLKGEAVEDAASSK